MSKFVIDESKFKFVSLGDIVTRLQYGYTGKIDQKGSIKYLRITDIYNDFVNWDNVPCVNISKNEVSKFFLKNKDILFARSGSVGNTYLYNSEDTHPAIFASYLIRIQIDTQFALPEYIYAFMQSQYYWSQIKAGAIGVTQLNFNSKKLAAIKVPLPSISEQKGIVAQYEKLSFTKDAIEQKINDISKLEERLVTYYSSGGQKKIKLGDYIEERDERVGTQYISFKKVGVDNKKGIVPLREIKSTNLEKYKIVKPGDFVYNPMRVNIGSIGIYEGANDVITSPDYVVFKVLEPFSKLFVLKYMRSIDGMLEINKNVQGSVRSRLYFRNLVNIDIPSHPILDQKAIDNTIKAFMYTERLTKKVKRNLVEFQKSILSELFKVS